MKKCNEIYCKTVGCSSTERYRSRFEFQCDDSNAIIMGASGGHFDTATGANLKML